MNQIQKIGIAKNKVFQVLITASKAVLLLGMIIFLTTPIVKAESLAKIKAYVDQITQPNPPWTGPTSGPKALRGKKIIYVASDLRNGGVLGVGEGIKEASKFLGWDVRIIDGQGNVSGRSAAMQQAITLKPDGIILGTIDANEQSELIRQADKAGIKIVGWHATSTAGPSKKYPIFTNISADPLDIAKAAASFVVSDSDGKAGVIVFTDSAYEIALAKSDAMIKIIKDCAGCRLLAVEDTPLAEARMRMPSLTNALLQRFGDQWTYTLTINDLPIDFMFSALISYGKKQDGYPRNVSAGDGSEAAFQRIRQKFYQYATVAEPLRLHGWQAVDEMNRALSGYPDSKYVSPVHLILTKNIDKDGGKNNGFDPDNGYREVYLKIWGVK